MKRLKKWDEKTWAAARVTSVALLSGNGAGLVLALATIVQLIGRMNPSALGYVVDFLSLLVGGYAFGTTFALSCVWAAYRENQHRFRWNYLASAFTAIGTTMFAVMVVGTTASFIHDMPSLSDFLFNSAPVVKAPVKGSL